jgi:hypothetical protein
VSGMGRAALAAIIVAILIGIAAWATAPERQTPPPTYVPMPVTGGAVEDMPTSIDVAVP